MVLVFKVNDGRQRWFVLFVAVLVLLGLSAGVGMLLIFFMIEF